MIKVVIFDAVGLVTRQEPLSVGLANDYNIPLDKSLPFFRGPLQDCVAGKADVKEVILPFLEEWGWREGVDRLLEYWFNRDHKIDHALVAHIQDLRKVGVKCLLATNNEKYRFAYMLDKMGFAQIFDNTYCSAYMGTKKPDEEFFIKIYKDVNHIPKDQVLFWDDKMENVEAAKKFGIHAERYTSFENFQEKMKQYQI